jgi:hypothetical protein
MWDKSLLLSNNMPLEIMKEGKGKEMIIKN